MPWPDIFWKSKKPKPEPEAPPAFEPKTEPAKTAATEPPTIKPVPATATVAGPTGTPIATPVSTPVPNPIAPPPAPSFVPPPVKIEPKPAPTIPATHGVVLRPPTGRTVQANALPQIQPPRAINPPKAPEPIKNIEQLMAEADPVRTLRQTGNVRVLAPLSAATPETAPLPPAPEPTSKTDTAPPITNPVKAEPVPRVVPPAAPIPPAANLTPVPTPTFRPAVTAPFTAARKIEPPPAKSGATTVPVPTPTPMPFPRPTPTIVPTPTSAATPVPTATVAPQPEPQPPPPEVIAKPVPPPPEDSPFILKSAPAVPTVPTPDGSTKILPPTPPTLLPMGSIFRRKARMADVARIVLPPKREDTQQLHPAPATPTGPTPTVVPPAFPVAAMTARATQQLPKSAAPEPVTETKAATPPPFSAPDHGDDSFILKPTQAKPMPEKSAPNLPVQDKSAPVDVVPSGILGTSNTTLPALDQAFDFVPPGHQPPTLVIAAAPVHEDKPIAVPEAKIEPEPKPVEAKPVEAKAAEAVPVEPVLPPASAAALSAPPATPEKREFHLANGERVAGTVLSETPEAIYVEHGTLGVITIPRANVAKRLVEIILVNGDRIVGDILAETADTLYVRHASLGMLTVPRAARSTRVVEAILKDGDRILGEVLTETDTFTVIRSASLGTITIPHAKLAMLNRKVEQIEMKALPPAADLKEKASN